VGLEKLEQTRRLLKRVLYASGICLFVTALTLYLAAPEIARLLSSSPAGQVKLELTVQSLSLVPLLIFLNNFFGTVYLVATGQARLYRNAIAVSALFLPCCLLTVPRFVGFVGYPLSLLLAESLLATLAVLWGAGALNSSVIRKEHEVS
jgi:Na+-driven multidrug efflux pump